MLHSEASAFACVIPGCAEVATEAAAMMCDAHFATAPDALRARFRVAMRRVSLLRDIWGDVQRYDAVVVSGRYLKLAHATACAEEALDVAAQRLALAVVAAQGRPVRDGERRCA